MQRRSTTTLLVLAVVLLHSAGAASSPGVQQEERLIGWQGESYVPPGKPTFKTLSWSSRIFLADNFLSQAEVRHLKEKAEPRLQRSNVVNPDEKDGSSVSDIRTSSGMFMERGEDDIVAAIEERIANWLMVPAVNGEGMQVLRYEPKQKYDEHFDYFFHEGGADNGGNRLVTVLMYLSDVEEGGETVFPNVNVPPGQTAGDYSPCAMKGLAVKPQAGSAVAFWSLRTDGRLDLGSLHSGCPVLKGLKMVATKWIHVARFAVAGQQPQKVNHVIHVPPLPPALPGCTDLDNNCKQWADRGECTSNSGYMIGTADAPGACLLSCDRCELGSTAVPEEDIRGLDPAVIAGFSEMQ